MKLLSGRVESHQYRTLRQGVMWVWDHEEVLNWDEYQYWMRHPLPFGWSIILEPEEPR